MRGGSLSLCFAFVDSWKGDEEGEESRVRRSSSELKRVRASVHVTSGFSRYVVDRWNLRNLLPSVSPDEHRTIIGAHYETVPTCRGLLARGLSLHLRR